MCNLVPTVVDASGSLDVMEACIRIVRCDGRHASGLLDVMGGMHQDC